MAWTEVLGGLLERSCAMDQDRTAKRIARWGRSDVNVYALEAVFTAAHKVFATLVPKQHSLPDPTCEKTRRLIEALPS